MSYATIDDVQQRWRTLTTDEQARAAVLLDDAANALTKLVNVDPSDLEQAEILRQVNANMVIRAMSAAESGAVGVSNASMTAGSYSQSWTYANPSGDMYLTKFEKRMLGVTAGYIGAIPAQVGGYYA